MKKYKVTFNSLELQKYAGNIIKNFQQNPENLEDSLPEKDYIEDNGEGEETWIIDTPNIENSFFYANEEERDEDYANLMQLIDLLFVSSK